MTRILQSVVLLIAICVAAPAQVVPAATGGAPIGNKLNYVLYYSQMTEMAGSLGDWQTAAASASVSYANGKDRSPFSMTYSGGYTWTLAGPSYLTGFFQHLLLSQGIVWHKWNFTVNDDASYFPEAPMIGFSGIPGIGEPVGVPAPPITPSNQSILTLNTHVVQNDVSGATAYHFSHATALSAGGSFDLLRYPDDNGLNMNTVMGNVTLTRRLDARNSLTGNYVFSQFSYPDYNFTFTTNSVSPGFEHVWSRAVTTNISAGPQWTSSSSSATVPPSTGVTVNASVNYKVKLNSASLIYTRGVMGGAGYLIGGESDDLSATFSHVFDRNLTIGFDGSFMRLSGLQNNGVIYSKYGGIQATRRMGRHFSAFANYTAVVQSSSSALPANTLSQLMQIVGFGISYSPRKTSLGH